MKFRGILELGGKTATGIEVPAEVVTGLGTSKRPAVQVTINGHTYASTVAVMGGRFMLPVSAENRAGAGIEAGDEIDVELVLDTAPRQVTVPEDLATALTSEPAAKSFFEGLSYSQQRWFVLNVEGAKTAETRQRRIDKSLEMLREGRAR